MLYYIYCIWVKTEDSVLRYYGHTQNMRVRKNKHISSHKTWVAAGRPDNLCEIKATYSVYILEHENWRMDKVDEIECEDKNDVKKLEGEYILKNECVNMYLAGRTKQEYNKQYREAYKEQLKKKDKQYYETHKEQHNKYSKEYREQHKDEIKAKQEEKITCEVCNAVVCKGVIARHRKSKKHLNALLLN